MMAQTATGGWGEHRQGGGRGWRVLGGALLAYLLLGIGVGRAQEGRIAISDFESPGGLAVLERGSGVGPSTGGGEELATVATVRGVVGRGLLRGNEGEPVVQVLPYGGGAGQWNPAGSAVRFWYRPNWSTTNGGPGSEVVLLDLAGSTTADMAALPGRLSVTDNNPQTLTGNRPATVTDNSVPSWSSDPAEAVHRPRPSDGDRQQQSPPPVGDRQQQSSADPASDRNQAGPPHASAARGSNLVDASPPLHSGDRQRSSVGDASKPPVEKAAEPSPGDRGGEDKAALKPVPNPPLARRVAENGELRMPRIRGIEIPGLTTNQKAARPAGEKPRWRVSIPPSGDRLVLRITLRDGTVFEDQTSPIQFAAGTWADLVINLFPDRVSVFLDGVPVLQRYSGPPASLLNQEPVPRHVLFALGSRADGGSGARGVLDDVEWWSRRLDRFEVAKRDRALVATETAGAKGLQLVWRSRPELLTHVERRETGQTNWLRLGEPVDAGLWHDESVEPGRLYEYRVVTNGMGMGTVLRAGYRLAPQENRGTTLILVDRTLAEGLAAPLSQLLRDLEADGWKVRVREAARHDDRSWRNNTNAIAEIRSLVRAEWERSGRDLRCLFLVGHVAVPYSGMRAEDAHTGRGDNHFGAWPSDAYYADVDGVWPDREPYPSFLSETRFAVTHNQPGDGKFDTEFVGLNSLGVAKIEMAFGRLDFAGMPLLGTGRRAEIEQITRYLEKAHRYRLGGLHAASRVVVSGFFNNAVDLSLSPTVLSATRLVGWSELVEGDHFRLPPGDTAMWGLQAAAGQMDRIQSGGPGQITSAQLMRVDRQPRVLFHVLLGSWFGDWAAGENNFLRMLTASQDYGLAAMWVRYAEWRVEVLARGGTLGDMQVETANEALLFNDHNRGTTRTLTILGDPHLRAYPFQPPRKLRGTRLASGVRLTWDPVESPQGVVVYRRSDAEADSRWERLTPHPILTGEYQDDSKDEHHTYLLRSAKLILTGSGSYTNLSQGIFWPGRSSKAR